MSLVSNRIANQDFTLTRDDCRPLYFKAGDEIPAEYENHWFVCLHTDEVAQQPAKMEEAAQAAEAPQSEPQQEKRKPGRPKNP